MCGRAARAVPSTTSITTNPSRLIISCQETARSLQLSDGSQAYTTQVGLQASIPCWLLPSLLWHLPCCAPPVQWGATLPQAAAARVRQYPAKLMQLQYRNTKGHYQV